MRGGSERGGIGFCIGATATCGISVRPPNITIEDVSLPEGDTGITPFEFLVRLSPAISSVAKVDYATQDGTATVVKDDYLPASGTLVFGPNETTQIIRVFVNGDKVRELDETVLLLFWLKNPSGNVFRTGQAIATIINDDFEGPGFPYDPTPFHLGSDVSLDITLQWACSHPQGKEVRYDLFFGDADWPIGRLVAGLSSLSYTLPTLSGGRTYAWKILATDGNNVTEGPKWVFKTRSQKHDLNHDGIVNLIDFAILAQEYLLVPSGPNVPGMVLVHAGEFEMGDHFAEGGGEERPLHTVYVSSFVMSQYEITCKEYCDFLNSAFLQEIIEVREGRVYAKGTSSVYCDTAPYGGSRIQFTGSEFLSDSNHPMYRVSWYGSAGYCNWRSQREGKEPCYDLSTWECDFSKHGYRLPTEAEWEYAARGGLQGCKYPWGNEEIDYSKANYNWCQGGTTPVGSYLPNGYGLYDIVGNVSEWCNDWYSDTYYGTSPYYEPKGPTSGTHRVFRNTNWGSGAYEARLSYRSRLTPDDRSVGLGFRVVLVCE